MVSLPPPRIIELFYDGAWNAVSMRESDPVTITRGVSAEGSRAEPTTASMTLDNRSGALSPRNPVSPLYGKVGRNTPIRLAVDAGGPYLDLPSGIHSVSTPDSAALDVLGDIDVRADVAPTDWTAPQMLAIRWGAGGHLHWALALHQDGQLVFWWSPTGLDANKRWAISTIPVPAHQGERLVVRATLDVNTGSGCTVTFSYAKTPDAAAWTLIGDPVTPTGSGTTSLFNATARLYIGDNQLSLTPDGTSGIDRLRGRAFGLRVYDGIDGILKVNLDTATQAAVGGSGFTDGTGLAWTVTGTAALSNRHVRMVGEVPAWPPSRDMSGNDRTVSITPAGITRRLGSGNKPLDSALRRYLAGGSAVECWPLTDGAEADRGASMLGGEAMAYSRQSDDDPPIWGDGTIADWVEPVVSLPGNGKLLGDVAYNTDMASGWSVDHVRSGPGELDQIHMHDWGAGSDTENRHIFQLYFQAPLNKILILRESKGTTSSSGASLGTIEPAGIFDGQPHHIRFQALQSGPNLIWSVFLDGVEAATGTITLTVKPLRRVEYWWGANEADLALGYITAWPQIPPDAYEVYQALLGFPGETAGDRMLRVAAEQSVPMSVAGALADQVALGTQQQERFLDALQSAALADRGYVLEQRDDRALIYRARSTLYNQPPVLTLDWSTKVIGAPFRPTDDDKDTQNDVTVQRQGGSKGFAVLEEGPMSVLDPPDGVGRYDREHTLSLAEDPQADQLASWIMHTGTYDGLRYTSITLNLGNPRVYAMAHDILRVDVGDKIRLVNLPSAQYGPDDVDLIVRGYTETIGADDWSITFNCTPGEPYNVLQLDAGEYSRLDTAGSELAAAIDADDTTLTAATTDGPIWIGPDTSIDSASHPDDMPFDVRVGGEVMTVSAITPAVSDAFTRTVASGWGAADVGGTWLLDGGLSSEYAVGSGYGTITHPDVNTARRTYLPAPSADVDLYVDIATAALATGASLFAMPTARTAHNSSLYMARVEFTTTQTIVLTLRKRIPAESQLGSTYTTRLTHTAGTWYRVRFQTSGSTLRARIWPATDDEPGAWQVEATDSSLTAADTVGTRSYRATGNTNANAQIRFDNYKVANPQAMTVIRSVNGVVKSHTAGSAVELAHPNYIPL